MFIKESLGASTCPLAAVLVDAARLLRLFLPLLKLHHLLQGQQEVSVVDARAPSSYDLFEAQAPC